MLAAETSTTTTLFSVTGRVLMAALVLTALPLGLRFPPPQVWWCAIWKRKRHRCRRREAQLMSLLAVGSKVVATWVWQRHWIESRAVTPTTKGHNTSTWSRQRQSRWGLERVADQMCDEIGPLSK